MRRFLPASVVGSLAFVAFILNTLFWSPFLILSAVVRTLVPLPAVVAACRWFAASIAANWIGTNVRGLRLAGDMRWEVTGPVDLPHDAWYLVTCNHRSWVDIVVVQWLFNRRIPLLKFFLKRELFWVPLLGLCWWALEFPFMRRYPRAVLEQHPELKHRDLETTRRACEQFRAAPVSVLNFLEGTRFSVSKRDRQGSPYRHLLLPRAGGIGQVASSLGDRLHAWLDVTIVYPGGTPTFWDLISGGIPAVRVDVASVALDRRWAGRDYETDAAFRDGFQAFVRELWSGKDDWIDRTIATDTDAPLPAAGGVGEGLAARGAGAVADVPTPGPPRKK